MAKINNTTEYPATDPAVTDRLIGTDISNTTNDANGETVSFEALKIARLAIPAGGAADNVLKKDTGTDYDYSWGTVPISPASVNAQTGTAYTLALTDEVVTMSNASANTLTIPTNASVAVPVGRTFTILQLGAGATTVTGDTGVTVNGVSAGSAAVSAQYGAISLIKLATDTWNLQGGTVA